MGRQSLGGIARIGPSLLICAAPFSLMVAIGPPLLVGLAPGYAQPVIELSDAAALLVVLAAALRRPTEGASVELRFTAALFAVAGLALVTSPLALSPPFAAYNALRWLLAAAVGWALVRLSLSPRLAALVLCAALLPHVAAAAGQALLQRPLGLPGELTLPLSAHSAAVVGAGDARWLRSYGLTFHPNVLGGYLCTAIVVALPWLGHRWLSALWSVLWGGLFLTFSRSAWLATALALPAAGAASWRHAAVPSRRWLRFAFVPAAVALLGGALLFSQQLGTRLAPLTGSDYAGAGAERRSLSDRVEMATLAWTAIRAHPLVGIGAGNFPLEMARQHTTIEPQYVHNVPLLLAAEVGVFGGMVWVAVWLAGVIALIGCWRTAAPDHVAALAAWCALGVIAMFDCYPWSLQAGRLLTALVLALVDCSRPALRR